MRFLDWVVFGGSSEIVTITEFSVEAGCTEPEDPLPSKRRAFHYRAKRFRYCASTPPYSEATCGFPRILSRFVPPKLDPFTLDNR